MDRMDAERVQEIAEQDWRARVEGAVAVAEQAAEATGPDGPHADDDAFRRWKARGEAARRLLGA